MEKLSKIREIFFKSGEGGRKSVKMEVVLENQVVEIIRIMYICLHEDKFYYEKYSRKFFSGIMDLFRHVICSVGIYF